MTAPPPALDRIARIILAAVHREYPNHITHLLEGDHDARPPRELTPVFYGSFDWHSAVHGHWALARLARLFHASASAAAARVALTTSFSPEGLAAEARYMAVPARAGFERPYGLAWLLLLCAELHGWDDADARRWRQGLAPLEFIAADRLRVWLGKLPWPLRNGIHTQTAFSLGLVLDWARAVGDGGTAARIEERARAWHLDDVDAPIAYEPSGHDFLSPALGEADLMRRVLPRDAFAVWLDRFLPDLEGAAARRWLTPVASPDPSDGHLAHLDGLNLSRAWMLEGIASALAPADPRVALLHQSAERHARAGLEAITDVHYAGSHWLGTYAVYHLTRRGVSAAD